MSKVDVVTDCGLTSHNAEALKAEKVRFLYGHLPIALIANLLLAFILITVQSTVIPASHRFGWLTALGMVLSARLALLVAWKRATSVLAHDARHWLSLFRVSVVSTGIVWGGGGIILSPISDIPHQIYVAFALSGLCAGAITSLAIDSISTFGFLLPTLMPFVVYLAADGSDISIGMSVMAATFLIFIAVSAWLSGRILHENFRLQMKAVEDETRFRAILEQSPVATRIIDIETNRVVFANKSYAALLNLQPGQVIGLEPNHFYAYPDEYISFIEKLSRGESVVNQLVELSLPNCPNGPKWALATYLKIEYLGKPGYLGWLYDITDRKRIEEQTQYLARHDPLTELPNRILLKDRLQQALVSAERDTTALALMFIDIDHFKSVNDSYGHDVGDLVLKEMAHRISVCLRKSDSVARIGGDEFIVLLPRIQTAEETLEIAERIRHTVNATLKLQKLVLHLSPSIGIAVYPEHAASERDLMKNADIAMYYAKAEGRNTVRLYNQGMVKNG